uniref:Uncharacterized protein n=1 Tax=Anopheles minimus TaxID=112268 RepID=A0A182WPI1_9DIPT
MFFLSYRTSTEAITLLRCINLPCSQQYGGAEHGRDSEVGKQHFVTRIQHDRIDAGCF